LFAKTIYFLVEAMLGKFTTTMFYEYRPFFGPTFLIAFLFIMPFIFLNLMVAILNFTYEIALKNG